MLPEGVPAPLLSICVVSTTLEIVHMSLVRSRYSLALMAALGLAAPAMAAPLLSPSDPIVGIDTDPPGSASSFPGAEGPGNVVDQSSATKYLNFAKENSGFIVTPASGASVIQSMVLTTANDAEARDPSSYEIYGTNDAVTSASNSLGNAESWTLISSGSLALPADRLTVGPVVSFANAASYTSYKVVFPTIKDSPATNSMQVADAQFYPCADALCTGVLAAGDAAVAIDTDIVLNSNYPGAEGPANILDTNAGTKYLNFGKVNSGFIVTPAGPLTVIDNFTITTANDAPERDPTAWELFGTTDAITSTANSQGDAENWTLIDSGTIDPSTDRGITTAPIDVEQLDAYSSYKLVFTGVRDAAAANSMQVADVQFYGSVVPEPATWALALAGLAGLALIRRR